MCSDCIVRRITEKVRKIEDVYRGTPRSSWGFLNFSRNMSAKKQTHEKNIGGKRRISKRENDIKQKTEKTFWAKGKWEPPRSWRGRREEECSTGKTFQKRLRGAYRATPKAIRIRRGKLQISLMRQRAWSCSESALRIYQIEPFFEFWAHQSARFSIVIGSKTIGLRYFLSTQESVLAR